MKTLRDHAALLFRKMFKDEPDVMTDEDVRLALRERPLDFAFEHNGDKPIKKFGTTEWECPNLYIFINGVQFGYVHAWSVTNDKKLAVVGHFAVEAAYVGKGFGKSLAEGLGLSLKRDFGTETILFQEQRYSDQYEVFFQRLGAIAQSRPQNPNVRDWCWKIPT
jgi:hypothetical protein